MNDNDRVYTKLINRLDKIYQSRDINGKKCFLCSDGSLFSVDYINSFCAFVIEYADSTIDAELNRFEDGDLHFIDGLNEEMLFHSIIQEIKEQ